MKPDNEPDLSHSTLPKVVSKPSEYNNSSFDTAEADPTMKESQDGILCQLHGYERKADLLAPEMKDKDGYWNTPEFEVGFDDFANVNEHEVKDSVEPFTIHTESFENDPDLYTDKNVMECDLPELIVCYKDSSYHVVKDICIDEGVPSESKIFVENVIDDCTSLPSNGCTMAKEGINTDFLIQDVLRSSSYKDCHKGVSEYENKGKEEIGMLVLEGRNSYSEDVDQDAANECGNGALNSSSESDSDQDVARQYDSEDLFQASEKSCNMTEKIKDDASREQLVSNSMLLVKEFRKETSLKSLLESSKHGDNDGIEQSNQISCVQSISEDPGVISVAEEPNKNGKLENGTITFNFDLSKPAASTKDQSPKIVQEPLESDNMHIHDDGISEDRYITSQAKHSEGGDSSFSIAGPLSDAVTYSGHIPFSGSISHRSDSSTTSTRSFAFPVLQSEWNSSPVRMAKADRRHFRKHRGWRVGLLCCRF